MEMEEFVEEEKEKEKEVKVSLSVSDIHEQVINMIRDLGYSEDEANVIKAGLYNYVKTEHPDLNAKARAEKMKNYVTKKHIATIDIMALKQAIEIHYQNKEKAKKKKEKN